jgi:hypothetical protein
MRDHINKIELFESVVAVVFQSAFHFKNTLK